MRTCLIILLLASGIGGCENKQVNDARKEDRSPARAVAKEVKFGDWTTEGDLKIKVLSAISPPHGVGGQYRGQFVGNTPMMMVRFQVKNTSVGKISEWQGWQDHAEAFDEFGNKFKPINLRGWVGLPNNDGSSTLTGGTKAISIAGDVGKERIAPGDIYENVIYLESAPKTSKKITVALPLNGNQFNFNGPIAHEW